MNDSDHPFAPLGQSDETGQASQTQEGWSVVVPVPIDAPSPPIIQPRYGRKPDARWRYADSSGSTMGFVGRWNTPTPDNPLHKDFSPLTLWRDARGSLKWRWKNWPEPRPLYGLERLANAADAPVIVAEGEKATDAAARLFPCHAVVTSCGGAKAVCLADWSPLAGRQVSLWPDHDEAGREYAAIAADLIRVAGAATVSIVQVPGHWPSAWDLADDLPEGVTEAELHGLVKEAVPPLPQEGPLPLRRPLPDAEPFPIDALGNLRGAAMAINELTQAPLAICSQSVLAAASLASQAIADVVLPMGSQKPLSCFFVTVAASGERKSACDELALRPVRLFTDELRQTHDADYPAYRRAADLWKARRDDIMKHARKEMNGSEADLIALGDEPLPPLSPILLCAEPTIEGLIKMLRIGQGYAGLFSTEGGAFVGGHGMSADNKLKTAAHLSNLWDGTTIDRVRAGDDLSTLTGRRLAAHLMVQPNVAARLLGDTELIGQGLLSRVLVTAPAAAAGTRFYRQASTSAAGALLNYEALIMGLLRRPKSHKDGRPSELAPRALQLSNDAQTMWIAYHDNIESQIGPSGALSPIVGLANKLPEHAARLAAVLTVCEQANASEIGADTMADGIALAEHYRSEALRLFEGGATDPDLILAQKVLDFMRERGGIVSLRAIYQFGPNAARDKATAQHIMRILEDHRCISKLPGGTEVEGTRTRDAWKLEG